MKNKLTLNKNMGYKNPVKKYNCGNWVKSIKARFKLHQATQRYNEKYIYDYFIIEGIYIPD